MEEAQEPQAPMLEDPVVEPACPPESMDTTPTTTSTTSTDPPPPPPEKYV
jgi:hypothetical protein